TAATSSPFPDGSQSLPSTVLAGNCRKIAGFCLNFRPLVLPLPATISGDPGSCRIRRILKPSPGCSENANPRVEIWGMFNLQGRLCRIFGKKSPALNPLW
ncbi:unnamed protein product, partial [Prunus brigantina]